MMFRQSTIQTYFRHQGYIINAYNTTEFTESFTYLLEDPLWNPSSKFIIVIRLLDEEELRNIFDELLKRHVVNVVVVSGIDNIHLYTYNPFDNYACGKYYNNVISYGLCSNTTRNLFPNKYVTGLRNCTLRATVPHQPPYTVHPELAEDERMTLGAEQYLFKVIAELEHFKVNFIFNSTTQSLFRHQGYLINAKDATKFTEYFKYLLEDPTWNPSSRFVIVIRSLDEDEMKKIFDELLKRHVVNVLVVSGADNVQLYTYNPFDNYACGKYYNNVISYDPTWNPISRFIIVIRSLNEDELEKIFDELLKRHVVNVLVVSGTDNVQLYTYNPFDNYGCGKYYKNVISYDLCSNITRNLFPNNYEILQAIHLSTVTTMIFRQATTQSFYRHQGYLINAKDATKFTEYFKYLLEDPTWNPSSRFIIVIATLNEDELKNIFDELLKRHVVNVVVVSGTDDTFLYSYNPFDNFACGRYYINIIRYVTTVIFRHMTTQSLFRHQGYLIYAKDTTKFTEYFKYLLEDPKWNPYSRFIIVIRSLDKDELKKIFDELLKRHVVNVLVVTGNDNIRLYTYNPFDNYACGKYYNNVISYDLKESDLRIVFDTFLKLHARYVVVVNATEEAHLYTYNPYDNYGCGKRYDDIISYGECSQAWYYDLYPKKIITMLRNCTFDVIITEWPPYTILSPNDSDSSHPLRYGAETYLFQLIGRMQGFKLNIINDYNALMEYPTVSTNMEAVGTLKKIQENEADAVLGGMLLTPSRALAFSYVYGHLAYTDEIRFVVKRASEVPAWKNIYLEFGPTVWALLVLALIFYSLLIIVLLRTEDKSYVVLILLGNLVLHGHSIRSQLPVKLHVNDAVIINGTDDAHLFTYNPFDNYACGKYYNDVISLGLCSQATQDLYPNKLVTGLRNCTFRASLAHRPPFAIDPLKAEAENPVI
ncbi:hypothetical protein PYW07_002467 [Mythimna separata]|uniref:Putative ionotropic receptor ligand binding domain-containing protein n=1 Tax=Mythimna separata TaxID=271217 RepID=A0AAD7YPP0_MYTSE|nr:hypothetical protein PYW07_002467 [Mythimna separata]